MAILKANQMAKMGNRKGIALVYIDREFVGMGFLLLGRQIGERDDIMMRWIFSMTSALDEVS